MTLTPIRLTCKPRMDALHGGLTDNHFAAQLDKVVRNPDAYPIYGDAEQFFATTYPTGGLRTLLSKSFGRVTGAPGQAGENGVLRSETSFGGGKTHGLAAVYHLARGARPTMIERFVDPALLPDGPVQIAAIVGDLLDPVHGLETNGVRSFTLWGEMAAQIGPHAVEVLAGSDAARTAPGKQTIIEAFDGQPTIVIIDEIAQHLRQATDSGDEAVRRYARSIPVFLKALSEVAGDPSNKVSVIVTLASTVNAFGKETNEIAELFNQATTSAREVMAEAQDVLTRMVQPSAVIKPADDAEIGQILKTRLFESIDPEAARAAGEAYGALYAQLVAEGEQFSGGAQHPATYAEQVEKNYPFHPELVRVLDKRLGTIPNFQRARGSLKLLSEVVAGIWRDEDDCDVINVGDIDFADEPIRSHLTIGLGRPEFSGVAGVDLAGPDSHAATVDDRAFTGKQPFATRVARTVFVHSLEMTVAAGAGRAEWLVGTLRPGEPVALLEKALAESERVCWHLSFDGARWRFHVEPNVNAIIEEEKRNVPNTQVAQKVDDLVRRAFSNDGAVLTIIRPAGPAEVPDEPRLRIVVVSEDQRTVTAKGADTPDQFLVDIMATTGQSKAPRRFRNSLVFVLADSDQVDVLKDRARASIAADAFAKDPHRMAQFSEDVRRKIEAYQKSATLEARIAVTRCFKHVYYPVQDKLHDHLRHRDLPAQQQGDTKSATSAVLTLLKDEGKVRETRPSYDWVKQKAWPATQPSIATSDLSEWFWIDHSSPIIQNITLLRSAVEDGIRSDDWVYHDTRSGKAYVASRMQGLQVEFGPGAAHLMTQAEAQARGLLVRKPAVADLRGLVFGSTVLTGAEVRSALEAKCGGEPAKGDVAEALAAAVEQNNYQWIVVVGEEPTNGTRALTPTQIKDKGLDGLRVVNREHAEVLGVVLDNRKSPERTRFTGEGASGVAFQSALDKVLDSEKPISRLVVSTSADPHTRMDDVNLLVSSLGMLQQFDMSLTLDLSADILGLSLKAHGTTSQKEYQIAHRRLKDLLGREAEVSASLEAEATFEPPIAADSAEIVHIDGVLRKLNISKTSVIIEVTK